MNLSADWVKYLQLSAHPEGGYFKENYRHSQEITINGTAKRNLSTSIYYMLESGQASKLHRLKSDEIWYFHHGSALKVHVFDKSTYQSYILGNQLFENHLLQLVLPAGAIFGAEVLESKSYSIIGCMVSPGFHFEDFELINASEILSEFANQKSIIERLT
jgi:uncharacterized protein